MNATMTATSRQPSLAIRRTGIADRLALRVGVALIAWGRRPVRPGAERYITAAELDELRRLELARHLERPIGQLL